MSHPNTVLVLTPSVGGYYYGGLLAGLNREVAGAGGRLLLVQTLEAGTSSGEIGEPGEQGDFAIPVAWSEVDGVVSITRAVRASFLQRLRDAGKPVVLASAPMLDFAAPLALPDNHGGTFAAVEHLIWHGHTRIGFVGNLAQPDVCDRHAAYLQALETHSLTADPALVFAANNNARGGGVRAALAVLESAVLPTALMVATDRNALGLMRTLTDSGLVLPRDMAIVGFDNIEAAAFSAPTLSSVNQQFDETGALAGRLIMAAMRGESVPHLTFTSPSVIAVRESCGCGDDDAPGAPGAERDLSLEASPALLLDELQDMLCGALLTGHSLDENPLRESALAIAREAERLLGTGDELIAGQIKALTSSLRRLAPQPEILRRVVGALTVYVQRAAAGTARGGGTQTAAAAAARLTTALWQLQAGTFLRQAEAAETALDEQYVVNAGLLDIGRSDPTELGWLVGTHVRAGVLALWEDGPQGGVLRIVGAYDPARLVSNLVGTTTTPEQFPPASLIAATQPADREVYIVVPVRTKERDWGLLAVVGEIETSWTREAYRHWAALLCVSLEADRMQEEVRRNALYDALTGLPNRRLFQDRLEHSIALCQREGTAFTVIFLDLDGFKVINDSLGHPMGDRVLNAVGARIERELREVDTGARFGGDEFAILLHDVAADGALLVAERLQQALAAVLDLDGRELSIRASMGVATSAIEYSCAEDVLRDADAAMYRAKATEPGSVSFFDSQMHDHAVHQMRLHHEIRRALEEDQFEIHYQPIVNLATGRTDRFEALVRWRHPERGLLLPEEFLPHIQDMGLMVHLGRWIIDEVCRQVSDWGPQVTNVAINVSDREFWHHDLLSHILANAARHGITADRLTLEITEGVIMRRPEVALRIMREMHDAGLRLHIDDFGTGYSSLETLHRFPVDAFKIDRSFIGCLTTGDRTDELVRAIVAMGKALGLPVVAEGVETTEQLAFLQEVGCATGQGFLFMPAVPGDRAMELLGHVLGPITADAGSR